MDKFRLFCFCFCFCLFKNNYAVNLDNSKHEYSKMSCNELMVELIRGSSFHKKNEDENLAKQLFYERYDDRLIILTYVCNKDCVYLNFELDLANQSLMYVDPSPSIPIKINKSYVPSIAEKCTPEENVYKRGKLPDSDES